MIWWLPWQCAAAEGFITILHRTGGNDHLQISTGELHIGLRRLPVGGASCENSLCLLGGQGMRSRPDVDWLWLACCQHVVAH